MDVSMCHVFEKNVQLLFVRTALHVSLGISFSSSSSSSSAAASSSVAVHFCPLDLSATERGVLVFRSVWFLLVSPSGSAWEAS